MIEGIDFYTDSSSMLFIIHCISDDLKELIRSNLVAICEGAAKTERNPSLYTYKNTLNEFLARYDTKPKKIKKGMIGELLAHVILLSYREDLVSVNPFFNLEERHIKKGLDIVYIEAIQNNKLWITEVKSGNLGEAANSKTKNSTLIDKAKNDLNTRLNDDDLQIWRNAINGASVAVVDEKNVRNTVIDILEAAAVREQTSKDKNVILVAVLYNDLSDMLCINDVVEKNQSVLKQSLFNDLIIMSVQKETYEAVIGFLREELEND